MFAEQQPHTASGPDRVQHQRALTFKALTACPAGPAVPPESPMTPLENSNSAQPLARMESNINSCSCAGGPSHSPVTSVVHHHGPLWGSGNGHSPRPGWSPTSVVAFALELERREVLHACPTVEPGPTISPMDLSGEQETDTARGQDGVQHLWLLLRWGPIASPDGSHSLWLHVIANLLVQGMLCEVAPVGLSKNDDLELVGPDPLGDVGAIDHAVSLIEFAGVGEPVTCTCGSGRRDPKRKWDLRSGWPAF